MSSPLDPECAGNAVGLAPTVGPQAPDEESLLTSPATPAPAPTTTGTAARAVDLTKVYGSGDTRVVALDDVSCSFERGQFTAIMGPSGSGKSTLMHCLAGLDDASGGAVFIGDTDVTGLDDKRLTRLRRDAVGFVFQPFNLLPDADRDREHHAAAGHRRPQAGPGVAGHRDRPVGLRDRLDAPADRALRRPAAAGGLRPRPGQPTRGHLRRRADRQPRLRQRRRGARLPAPLGHRHAPDHRHGHPRPGRRGVRRPRAVPRRRPDRRRAGRADRRAGPRPDEEVRVRARRGRASMLRATFRSLLRASSGWSSRRCPSCWASRSSPARSC